MPPRAVVAALLLAPALAGCADGGPGPSTENPIEPCGSLFQTYEPEERYNPHVRLDTTNGTATLVVYGRQVPFTAGHFLRLVEDDVYEDTRFHRLVPGELVVGGDPRSRSEDREAWGTGGYNYNVVDAHHQFLRHDEPGIVSLKSPRPNTGGSQFLITLDSQPSLDDRNPVFGRVVEGLDTVRELARTPTDDQRRPIVGARLHNATRLGTPVQEAPPPELSAYGFDCRELAEPGDTAEFLFAVRNTGQSVLNGTLNTKLGDAPGWDASLTNAEGVVVSAGQTVVYRVNVTVPDDADPDTRRTVDVRFEDQASNASVERSVEVEVGRLGEPAVDQDRVRLRYVGLLEDGRPFDTTETVYADADDLTWFRPAPTDPSPVTLEPSPQTLNRSQPGRLVERAQLGETVVGFVPPEQAYGTQAYGEKNLGGRLLVFQVHVSAVR